ncbi:hypothetical protein BDZ94DRAFT_1272206 [Collybia nuda]|uniref:Uncharacterized protein n=1 Tax=Collybia nuda TaxID=64659 RepID=A0A9P5XVK0_9AGAR|nr:hypothetical protein BDZ94DRAFT_1272206 [Collybia nuda]
MSLSCDAATRKSGSFCICILTLIGSLKGFGLSVRLCLCCLVGYLQKFYSASELMAKSFFACKGASDACCASG